MTGTYLSERHGDTYQLWYIDGDGDSQLIAEGLTSPHQVADVEADHRRMREQRKADQ